MNFKKELKINQIKNWFKNWTNLLIIMITLLLAIGSHVKYVYNSLTEIKVKCDYNSEKIEKIDNKTASSEQNIKGTNNIINQLNLKYDNNAIIINNLKDTILANEKEIKSINNELSKYQSQLTGLSEKVDVITNIVYIAAGQLRDSNKN